MAERLGFRYSASRFMEAFVAIGTLALVADIPERPDDWRRMRYIRVRRLESILSKIQTNDAFDGFWGGPLVRF
jgi:hypothetical protein